VFFDRQSTGLRKAFYLFNNSLSRNVRGLRTSQLERASTFKRSGWDETIWGFDQNKNNGYPYLKSKPEPLISKNFQLKNCSSIQYHLSVQTN
jgi:hypothetical protein